MSEISKEKIEEHFQVAVLTSWEIDCLEGMMNEGLEGKELADQVRHLIEQSKEIRNDPVKRAARYSAMAQVFRIVGLVPEQDLPPSSNR